jgi:hypothetical protein
VRLCLDFILLRFPGGNLISRGSGLGSARFILLEGWSFILLGGGSFILLRFPGGNLLLVGDGILLLLLAASASLAIS